MSEASTYLIDSDVLITAKNRYYTFRICPGFWDSVLHAHALGLVQSIDRVQSELLNGSPDDDLVQWVSKDVPLTFFHSCSDSKVVDAFREIMLWAQRHTRYTDAAKAKFASGADGWLVASVGYMERPSSRTNNRRLNRRERLNFQTFVNNSRYPTWTHLPCWNFLECNFTTHHDTIAPR